MNPNMEPYKKISALFDFEPKTIVRLEDPQFRGRRKAKPPVKYGKKCSVCGLKMSLTGSCFCDD